MDISSEKKASETKEYNLESAILIKNEIEFLDSLIRCGEGPNEVQCDVSSTTKLLKEVYLSWITKQGFVNTDPFQAEIIEPYMRWVYLCQYPKKCYLFKVSKKLKTDFVNIFAEEMMINDPTFKILTTGMLETFCQFLTEIQNVTNQ